MSEQDKGSIELAELIQQVKEDLLSVAPGNDKPGTACAKGDKLGTACASRSRCSFLICGVCGTGVTS